MSEIKPQIAEENNKISKTVETQIENEDSNEISEEKEIINENIINKEQNGQKNANIKKSLLIEEFQRKKGQSSSKNKFKTRSLKSSPLAKKLVKKNKKIKIEENTSFDNGKEEMILRPSSPMLSRFMKPAPKIYKKKQIGKKKYLIHAQPKPGIEGESYHAKNKKSKNKRNFNTYQTIEFDDDESLSLIHI